MTRLGAISTLPRLGRAALVLALSFVSISLLGAASAGTPAGSRKPVRNASLVKTTAHTIAKTKVVSRELMHDLSPSAAKAEERAALASGFLAGHSAEKRHVVMMLVTAYCPCPKCCGSHARGLTASGLPVSFNGGRFVAADTHLFRFGTRLQVPGYAGDIPVPVIDKGGAIKGNHIDVFFPTHQQALDWGRKWVAVTIDE